MKSIFWFIGKALVFLVLLFILLNEGISFQRGPIVHSDWYGVKVKEIPSKPPINSIDNERMISLRCTLDTNHTYIGTPFPFYYEVGSNSCYDVYISFYGLVLSIFTVLFISWLVFFKLDKILKKLSYQDPNNLG